jgi:hypothetical protein
MNNLSDTHPPMTMRTTEDTETTTNQPWKKNPSASWTTSLRASDLKRSLNSKLCPTSFRSSISTPQGLSERRMSPSSTTHARSTKLKPSLLQRLSEVNMPNEDSNHLRGLTEKISTQGTSEATKLLTNSYHNSVKDLEEERDQVHKTSSTTTMTPVSSIQTLTEHNQTRSAKSSNLRCHGSLENKKQGVPAAKNARNHAELSHYSLETTKLSSNGFKPREQRPLVSQPQSGTTLSEDKLLTSTLCSPHCTMYPLLKRTLDAWDQLKSPLVDLNQQERSKRAASGPAHGMPPSKRLNSLSLTVNRSLGNTLNTSRAIFLPQSYPHIERSSYTMQQSEMKSVEDKMLYSLTHTGLLGSTQPSSCQMELNQNTPNLYQSVPLANQAQKLNSATDSTLRTDARTQLTAVGSDTHANDASGQVTDKTLATLRRDLTRELQPKYLRHNIWDGDDYFSKSSADWSETAKPLPSIPNSELANPVTTKTIRENPRLFDIVTPINVDRFENLLQSHPRSSFRKICMSRPP